MSNNNFLTILEKNARNQNSVPVPSVSQEDLTNRGRLIQTSKFIAEDIRKSQPSYFEARKLFGGESSQQLLSDQRDKNALILQQTAPKIDQDQLKKDLDGIFGGNGLISDMLFGQGVANKDLGKKEVSRGLLGFFTGSLLESTPEKEAKLYEVLLNTGATPKDALAKAKAEVAGDPIALTGSENAAIKSYEAWDTAFKMLDAGFLVADVVSLGTFGIVKPLVKAGARRSVAPFIKEASKMTNRNDLRKLVAASYPELKGSQELEKMLDIVQEYPQKFSLTKARKDFQRTESFQNLGKTANPIPVDVATEAQRVIYKDGIPVLRHTTPDSLVARRAETLDVIKGARERFRLSNPDILHQEIQAGALDLKTTANDTINVWRVASRGRRIENGEEVSLSEKFAKSLSEGAKPEQIQVPVSDLVRMKDGSFTYAPERLIKESPALKFPTNISKNVIKEAKTKEAAVVKAGKEKARKELADKEADRIAKQEAQKKADEALLKPARDAQAKLDELKNKPVNIRAEAQKKIIDIRTQRDIAKSKVKGAAKKAEVSAKYQKQIVDVTRQKNLDVAAADQELAQSKGKLNATIKKATETAQKTKATKEATETSEKTVTGTKTKSTSKSKGLKPVGTGAIRESKLYKSTQESVRAERERLGDAINSSEYEFYRQAVNDEELANASSLIETRGLNQTLKDVTSAVLSGKDATDGILNNSIIIALQQPLMEAGMTKEANDLIRLTSALVTRYGQEIQILSTLDRNNPFSVMMRLQMRLDQVAGGKGVLGSSAKKGSREVVDKELRALVKEVGTTEDLKSALTAIKVCE